VIKPDRILVRGETLTMEKKIDFGSFVSAVRELDLEEPESQAVYHLSRVSTADWKRVEEALVAEREKEPVAEREAHGED
jgi:hypothetical protein